MEETNKVQKKMWQNFFTKNKLFTAFILILLLFFINACEKPEIDEPISHEEDFAYSFFVAGHTYGTPGTTVLGLYSEFKKKYSFIQNYRKMEFGVFTGDIVKEATVESWDAVDKDVDSLNLPVFFAVGNHDMKDRELYEERYGKTFFDTIIYNDLFIFLDPNIDNYNISGEQLLFLQQTVNNNYSKVDNILVFFHQLLWWDDDNIFKNIRQNYPPYTPDTSNFWTEVEPIFHNLPNKVVMFAGDIGATSYSTPFMYYKYDNITFIAGGMGSGISDNFLIVSIDNYKTIHYKLIALQNETNSLGKLEDFILP